MLKQETIQSIILTFCQACSERFNTPRINFIDAIANDPEVIGIFTTFSMQNTKVFLEYNKETNTFKELFPESRRELDTKHIIKDNQFFQAPKIFETVFTIWQTTFHITQA